MYLFYCLIKRIMASAFVFALLHMMPRAEAFNYFSNCCTSFSDWDVCIGIDYLYWMPCAHDLNYVAQTVGEADSGFTTLVDIQNICPDWESGYRIHLKACSLCFPSLGLSGSYTHLESSLTDFLTSSQESSSLFPVFTHPLYGQLIELLSNNLAEYNSAAANWETDYYQWSAGLTYQVRCNHSHQFIPFIGVGGLHFDENFNTLYTLEVNEEFDAEATFTVANLEVTGVGLKLGASYHYSICNGFRFFTDVSGTVLVGETKSNIKFGSVTDQGVIAVPFPDLLFSEKDDCAFIPGYHLGAGLRYNGCLYGIEYMIKLGYEFVAWHHLPDYRRFVEGVNELAELANALNIGVSHVTYSRVLAYHGLSAGVGFRF